MLGYDPTEARLCIEMWKIPTLTQKSRTKQRQNRSIKLMDAIKKCINNRKVGGNLGHFGYTKVTTFYLPEYFVVLLTKQNFSILNQTCESHDKNTKFMAIYF